MRFIHKAADILKAPKLVSDPGCHGRRYAKALVDAYPVVPDRIDGDHVDLTSHTTHWE